MTINIELQPDEERDLLERARASGSDLAGYIHQILQGHLRKVKGDQAQRINGGMPTLKELIDEEAIERCAREVEGKNVATIEEVRAATSKIKDSMARVVIEEERAERF